MIYKLNVIFVNCISLDMTSKLTRHYIPELLALSYRRKRPAMVTVNLTSRCNQSCIYCEIGQEQHENANPELNLEDLTWILDQMDKAGIPKISLCGGEPFLFREIMKVISYARSLKIHCSVTTNGMNLRFLEKDDLYLLKESQTEINLSIDSFRKEVQTFTRGNPAALELGLESLRILQEWHIPVTMLTVITRFNYDHLSEIFTEAHNRGIRQVLFQPVIVFSNYADRPPIQNKAWLNHGAQEMDVLMDQLRRILHFERTHPIRTNVYRLFPWIAVYLQSAFSPSEKFFFKNLLGKFYCREVDAIIDITYDGGIQPCGLLRAATSVKERQGMDLLGLWNEATSGLRHDLEKGLFPPECNGCCHHFSRNMLASAFRFPLQNRKIIQKIIPLVIKRTAGRVKQKLLLISL